MTRVFITGLGAISSLGLTVEENWTNALHGTNGLNLVREDFPNHQVSLAGQIKNYNPLDFFNKKRVKRLDRSTQLGLVAAKEALDQDNLVLNDLNLERFGVFVSSGIGGLSSIEREYQRGQKFGFDRVSPFFIPMAIINILSAEIAIEYGLKGASLPVVTACASATHSLGLAFHSIRDGKLDLALAGGAESAITNLGLGGFTAMKALHIGDNPDRASIPFDKDRDGFVMGEGAGILLLESEESAKKRGATIYGEIIGFGASSDAYHITSPDPEGRGAYRAMDDALKDANLDPKEIDLIHAHGTSTQLNDQLESKAIFDLFKDQAKNILVTSTKSMTGHLLGASGGLESIFAILSLKDGICPPTINSRNNDPACPVNMVSKAQNFAGTYALKNSFGFGGHNASLVFKKIGED